MPVPAQPLQGALSAGLLAQYEHALILLKADDHHLGLAAALDDDVALRLGRPSAMAPKRVLASLGQTLGTMGIPVD